MTERLRFKILRWNWLLTYSSDLFLLIAISYFGFSLAFTRTARNQQTIKGQGLAGWVALYEAKDRSNGNSNGNGHGFYA